MIQQEQIESKDPQEMKLQPQQNPGLKVKTSIKAGQEEEEVEA